MVDYSKWKDIEVNYSSTCESLIHNWIVVDLTFYISRSHLLRYRTMKTKPIQISIHHHYFDGGIKLVWSEWKSKKKRKKLWIEKEKRKFSLETRMCYSIELKISC